MLLYDMDDIMEAHRMMDMNLEYKSMTIDGDVDHFGIVIVDSLEATGYFVNSWRHLDLEEACTIMVSVL